MEETMKLSYLQRTGHARYKVVHKNNNAAARARRQRALQRLQERLPMIEEIRDQFFKRTEELPMKSLDWEDANEMFQNASENAKRIKKEINILLQRV